MFRVLCRGGEGTKEGGTQWKKAGKPIPSIVLGTDNVGIFATNIYNKYCNLYCQLHYKKLWNSNEIMDVIRELDIMRRYIGLGGWKKRKKGYAPEYKIDVI